MSIVINTDSVTSDPHWCHLFNQYAFYNLHKQEKSFYFSFKLKTDLIGVCHFTELEKGIYKSPYRGTFGSISFKADLDLSVKHECVELLIKYFNTLKAKKLIIVSEPFAHNAHHSGCLLNAYLVNDFVISNHEINYSLPVDGEPLIDKMMRNNKKRLTKCKREGFVFEQCFEMEDLKKVYAIIQENRKSKGFAISMTFEQIMQMYDVFKDSLYFFKASQNNVDVASSICIRLNPNVLYVFYWGDLLGFREYSPIAFIADGIYRFAQENNFKLLDAGVSSINGNPNFGLVNFKENLGFLASPKLTYTLDL